MMGTVRSETSSEYLQNTNVGFVKEKEFVAFLNLPLDKGHFIMEDIRLIDIIVSVFTSGGVTAVAVVAACKWITKQIIEEAISVNNEKYLANFNSILERQNKILETDLAFKRHIWEEQYNNEFDNYLNIWEALREYVEATLHLRNLDIAPSSNYTQQEEKNNLQKKKWEEKESAFKSLFIGKAPFYQKKHYEKFAELDDACKGLYKYYEGKRFNVQIDERVVKEFIENVQVLNDEILDELRKYLQSLKEFSIDENDNRFKNKN